MKILFVWRKIDNISGGLERISAAVMNGLIARGFQISFLSWDHEGARAFYYLDDRITWYKLGIGDPKYKAGLRTRLQRMQKVRRIVKKDNPDVILNFESGIFFSMRMFLTGFRIPFVAAERNAVSRFNHLPRNKYKVFAILILADYIIVQFERYKLHYPRFLRKKITVINNPVQSVPESASPKGKPGESKTLLCVARLAYQKNLEVLIEAFAELSPDFSDWTLKIAGGGEYEKLLQDKVAALGPGNRIQLLGAVKDVKSLYLSAHLFCLPSRYEGFPNALSESLAHGLPAVGFKESCGVRDLIQHKVTGCLAEGNGDKESLKQSLRHLMENDNLRVDMGRAAKESMKIYDLDLIFDQWETFFKKEVVPAV